MSVKINTFELENVKRIKAVAVEPTADGLTVIGGRNNQGKTSVLDAIAWALGGAKYKPSEPHREGSMLPPSLKVTLSNGLIVERKGKNSELRVIDPNGNKAGQKLLDSFIEQLALDIPKFMESTSKEKANILLQILGIGEKLIEIEMKEKAVYDERTAIGRIALQKQKYADELDEYPEVGTELVSAAELIHQQQAIMAQNAENMRKRQNADYLKASYNQQRAKVEALQNQLNEARDQLDKLTDDLEIAQKSILDLVDQSTEELEENIRNVDAINVKVRSNIDKKRAIDEAALEQQNYEAKTEELNAIRKSKMDLLASVKLPLDGLAVVNGEIIYKGQQWDNMSGSDQLKVATAIVRKLNPNCGFVLLDKLEQMDIDTMNEFGKWLEAEGLQAIATRVSTGDECTVIIEDGYVKGKETAAVEAPKWKAGQF